VIDQEHLLNCGTSAMILHATHSLIRVEVEINNENALILHVFLERVATEDERDCYTSLLSEIENQFVEFNSQSSDVVYHLWNQNHNNNSDRLVIFSRCTFLDNNGDIRFGNNVKIIVES
jgi:hypothetical protein